MSRPAHTFLPDLTTTSTLLRETSKSIEDAATYRYPLSNDSTIVALLAGFQEMERNLSLIESFCRISEFYKSSSEMADLRQTLDSCREHILQLRRIAVEFDHDLKGFIRRALMGGSYYNTGERLEQIVAGLKRDNKQLATQYHKGSGLSPSRIEKNNLFGGFFKGNLKAPLPRESTPDSEQQKRVGQDKPDPNPDILRSDPIAPLVNTMNKNVEALIAGTTSNAPASAHTTNPSIQKSHGLSSSFNTEGHEKAYTETVPTTHQTCQEDLEMADDSIDLDCDDGDTTYSIDTTSDDMDTEYLQAFAHCLARDIESASNIRDISDVPSSYLRHLLREFSWKLHDESSNPFQWGTRVTLHKQRANILDALINRDDASVLHASKTDRSNEHMDLMSEDRTSSDNYSKSDQQSTGDVETSSDRSGIKSQDEPRTTFVKTADMLSEWLSGVPNTEADNSPEIQESQHVIESSAPTLSIYETFIRESEAYSWLVTRICHHERLVFPAQDAMTRLGQTLQHPLQTNFRPRKMSHRRPASPLEIDVRVDWHPLVYLADQEVSNVPQKLLDHIVCGTGTWCEAQVTTVSDYLRQTWPITCEPIIELFEKIFHSPQAPEVVIKRGSNCPRLLVRLHTPDSCTFSLIGGLSHITEAVEQIAWLVTALHPSAGNEDKMMLFPTLTPTSQSFNSQVQSESGPKTYRIYLEVEDRPTGDGQDGYCWLPLFSNISIVSGFPILRRPQSDSGLELSLEILVLLIRSWEIVQCGRRIMMKGFDSLLLATMATTTMVSWHLSVSGEPGKRVGYFDTTHSEISDPMQGHFPTLQTLRGARHIVGWCPDAEDMCGHKGANHIIATSGLPPEPSSIVIDRLYVEGGMNIIAGLNMRINQKRDPVSLMRDQDYPSLLKWIATQPIVFFDTNASDRRAWLIDGASALLHLVRISLYRDENDDESTFEWVFDATKLNDTWPDVGRSAAIKTLKNTENLNLPVYVKLQKGSSIEYSTYRDRVIKTLHSLELLIDYQRNEAAKGEIRTLQTLDRRKHIIGFDILDVLEPIGSIHSLISRFDSWGEGWIDLVSGIGATTLFGHGFGDLVRPKNPMLMCDQWRNVPTRKDYLCSSVSTLRMLHEKRFIRSSGALAIGKLTSKISWVSPIQPFATCSCVGGSKTADNDHSDHTQFLISSKQAWKSKLLPKNSSPVDLSCLDERGAVVFANLGLLGRRIRNNPNDQKGELSLVKSTTSDGSHSTSAAKTSADTSGTPGSSIAASLTTMNTPPDTTSTEIEYDLERGEHGRKAKRRVSRLVAVFTKN